jgi:hypothetical protein
MYRNLLEVFSKIAGGVEHTAILVHAVRRGIAICIV